MRTKKAIKNIFFSLTVRIVVVLLTFIITPYVLKGLGKDLYGLNSLMLQTVGYLGLAELGLGKAINVAYYKVLAQKDKYNINIVYTSANKIYLFISILIFLIGIISSFFLEYFFNINPELLNLARYVFIIYAIKSSVSYFFATYKSLILSDQKQYKFGYINLIFRPLYVISNGLVIFFNGSLLEISLFALLITIVFELSKYIIVKKHYPFLEKTKKTEYKSLLNTSIYVFINKILNLSYKRLDYILIGVFLSLSDLASFSIYMTFSIILIRFFISYIKPIQPGIGNLIHNSENKKIVVLHKDMLTTTFFFQILICSILIFFLQNFITNWVGDEMLIDGYFKYLFVLILFIQPTLYINNIFIDSKNLFKKKMYGSIIEFLINILASIIFVKIYGISGLLLGTILGYFLVNIWYVPFIFNKSLKINSVYYFKDIVKYFSFFGINLFFSYFFYHYLIKKFYVENDWLNFIFCTSLFSLFSLMVTLMTFYFLDRNSEAVTKRFKKLYYQIKNLISK